MTQKRHKTVGVKVGKIQVGGGAPVVVQSMTNTDTVDIASTAQQCLELAQAGSELVRITVNIPEAAQAVPEIKKRLLDAGCDVPLIGDFHYNGHVLLTKYPDCARALDKLRINPGNVGAGQRRDEQFSTICKVARDNGKPVRIGVNGGSLNQELVMKKMQENTDRDLGKTSEEIINDCSNSQAAYTSSRRSPPGRGVSETRIVSPIPSSSKIPMEAADQTRPLAPMPASVKPRCSGCSVLAERSR